jgi:Co/Zn/Cd efflux system component
VSRAQRLALVLALNLALVVGLIAVGAAAHSLAVLAEGGDYLLDVAGVGVPLLTLHLSAGPAKRERAHKAA